MTDRNLRYTRSSEIAMESSVIDRYSPLFQAVSMTRTVLKLTTSLLNLFNAEKKRKEERVA